MITALATPTLRPFRPADIALITNRDGHHIAAQQILEQARGRPAFTAECDGQPLGCAGILFPWPGLGIVWMILSDQMLTHKIWLTRTVKGFLEDVTRRHQLHRIEAVALEESPRNQLWLEALGFLREDRGIATAYLSDRRNMIRYERITEAPWP